MSDSGDCATKSLRVAHNSVSNMAKETKEPKKAKAAAAGKVEKPAKKAKVAEAPAKKEKKKKDPNAPKKGMSAYFFFMNENREKIKTENPGIAFTEIAKVAGEKWKAVSAEEKAKYEKMAANDKERYAKDMKKYTDNKEAEDEEEEDDE